MKPYLRVCRATIKGIPRYTCSNCGQQADGDAVTLEIETHCDPQYVGDLIEQRPIHNNHMPVGWAGYGLYEHRCPRCAS